MDGKPSGARRARRGMALVCLALAGAAASGGGADAAAAEASDGYEPKAPPSMPLAWTRGDVRGLALRPNDAPAARPPIVLLHGRCGHVQNACSEFRDAAHPFGWLVCPSANARCPGGGASWSGDTREKQAMVDAAIAEVADRAKGEIDPAAPGLLIGFSQGAYVGLDLALHHPGKYRALLLIGAEVAPPAAALRAAGIRRVVLAAGAYDAARPAMDESATKLARDGYPARFVSLGAVGHTYVPEKASVLDEAVAWLEAP